MRDVLDTPAAGARILTGGVLRFGGYVGTVALSLISVSLLTRHLGPADFGAYTTIVSLVTVVSTITDAGMANVGVHEYARRSGAQRALLMRDLLGLRIALNLVGIALAIAFALAAGYRPALLLGTLLAGAGTMALVWAHTYSIPISTSLRLGVLAGLDLGRQALSVALIVALVLTGAGVAPLLAVMLLANAAFVPVTALFARGAISARPSLHLRRWVALLRPAVSFSLATAVGTLYVYTAQILTSLVADHRQSGLFAVSFRVFIVAGAVPGLLVGGALPVFSRAARDDHARLEYALGRVFDVTLVIGAGATLALIAGARFVVAVIAGPRYFAAVPVLQVQALGLLASFVLAGPSYALLSLERFRALLLANAVAFAVSCALTLALASAYGATGAAIATVCSETTLAVGYTIALARSSPKLRPRAATVRKVAVSATPAAVVAWAILLLSLPSVLSALLGVAVYGVLILATRALPEELAQLIARRRAPASGR